MGSSEIVDSGRFSGGRSNFMQTCSLLSQYLKEKGSFGDLNLGFTPNMEPIKVAPTATMNLLPMIDKTTAFPSADRNESQKKSDLSGSKIEAEPAPLTIFYGGQVIVFNDFPAEKANEIMTLASNSTAACSTQNHHNATFAPLPAESTTSIQNIVPAFGIQEPSRHSDQPALDSDLPIARKNSLARFLEKRKDRITANAPYPARKRAVGTGAWLGLAPQFPPRLQRH